MSVPALTTSSTHGPLGHVVVYASHYDPELLFPIPRAANRAQLGIASTPPFHGVDIWNAYELSWLDARGKPEVALAEFRIPATSPAIIESKSFKLYLNSFNSERLPDAEALRARLIADLSTASGAPVAATLTLPARFGDVACSELAGTTIDDQSIEIDAYGPPNAAHLRLDAGAGQVEESLISNLLKSNCPVTGQPDWASVQIRYAGAAIDRAGLLRYLVSFREHAEFHEHCVERIFVDVMQRCAPSRLSVYARYTRRGGLDINPWRGTSSETPPNPRVARQ
ncbi:MAG: NADPH-dependent 7-cyano-7-deazaguanine reductase QueF [Dokdonella sp.]